MMRIKIKKMLTTTAVLIFVSFNCSMLFADLQGDAARSSAATRAAMFAAQNVVSLNKEIKSKMPNIIRTNRLFDELQKKKKQWKDQIEKTKKHLLQAQSLIAATREKITKKANATQEKIQSTKPLIATLQQANMQNEIIEADQAVQQFQKVANDVSEIFKSEYASLEKINAEITALEGK